MNVKKDLISSICRTFPIGILYGAFCGRYIFSLSGLLSIFGLILFVVSLYFIWFRCVETPTEKGIRADKQCQTSPPISFLGFLCVSLSVYLFLNVIETNGYVIDHAVYSAPNVRFFCVPLFLYSFYLYISAWYSIFRITALQQNGIEYEPKKFHINRIENKGRLTTVQFEVIVDYIASNGQIYHLKSKHFSIGQTPPPPMPLLDDFDVKVYIDQKNFKNYWVCVNYPRLS